MSVDRELEKLLSKSKGSSGGPGYVGSLLAWHREHGRESSLRMTPEDVERLKEIVGCPSMNDYCGEDNRYRGGESSTSII